MAGYVAKQHFWIMLAMNNINTLTTHPITPDIIEITHEGSINTKQNSYPISPKTFQGSTHFLVQRMPRGYWIIHDPHCLEGMHIRIALHDFHPKFEGFKHTWVEPMPRRYVILMIYLLQRACAHAFVYIVHLQFGPYWHITWMHGLRSIKDVLEHLRLTGQAYIILTTWAGRFCVLRAIDNMWKILEELWGAQYHSGETISMLPPLQKWLRLGSLRSICNRSTDLLVMEIT